MSVLGTPAHGSPAATVLTLGTYPCFPLVMVPATYAPISEYPWNLNSTAHFSSLDSQTKVRKLQLLCLNKYAVKTGKGGSNPAVQWTDE